MFGYRDSLQQKGERRTHQSVDERVEQGYSTDIGCHVEQHGRVIQQLHSQLNILWIMKQTKSSPSLVLHLMFNDPVKYGCYIIKCNFVHEGKQKVCLYYIIKTDIITPAI